MSINSAPTTTTTNVTLSGINVSVNISGQNVIASISGQTVLSSSQISGQVVIGEISGQTVAANVSGNTIRNQVFDVSGQVWRDWIVSTSGSSIPLVGIGHPASGTSAALAINTVNTDVVSSARVTLPVQGLTHGYDSTTNQWPRMRITASGQGISGVTNKLIVAFSGDTSFEYGTAVRAHAFTVVTNLSGGTEAGSGSCFGVTIRNHSGNGPMLLGGIGAEAPFSGKGMIVYGGESYDLKVDNFNKVRALAYTSGQLISVAGVDK